MSRGYAIPSALILVVLCGVAAIAIDLGHGRLLQARLQAVSDAAAHAGALQLDSSTAGLGQANHVAVVMAAANVVHGAPFALESDNVETGVWDHDALSFTPSTDAGIVNAVSVLAHMDGIDTWFAGPAFRRDTIAASGRATAVRMPPPVACAVLAATDFDATGNAVTDSYDSAEGPYDSSSAGSEGNICGNAVLDVAGNLAVHGDAVVGRGGEIVPHGAAHEIHGEMRYLGSKFEVPELDPSAAQAENDNGTIGLTSNGRDPWHTGGIRLSSDETLTLSGGVYYFESLRITGSASLIVDGPTDIWVDGDVNVGGTGIVNSSANPHDLTLYVTGDDVSMHGTSDFYGSLIAPEADVDLNGTNDFYGIVIGGTVDLSGDLRLHADVSLMEGFVLIEPWIALVE
ncbi:MAG: Tad domain-containing protein [Deltaproteobacteria bacterium]|nr:Tad domain-containing protein [Deltaproteobacteria bacterium]